MLTRNIIKSIKYSIKYIGEWASWLNIILIILIAFDVIYRYAFNSTYNWVIELEWQIFGLIFLLGSAYTLQKDKHVRVDVFYNSLSEKWKNRIDVIGTIFLLIPWCLLGISTCYNYASNSFYIREGSPNPGGLPAWYVIKYIIVLGFALLLAQGITTIYEKINKINL